MSEERWPIPRSWEWVYATDVSRIFGGGTPPSDAPENFAESGIPWITPSDLKGYKDSHIARGRRDLSEIGYASSSATLVPPGTVLFSSRAPIGYCVVAANEISTNQGFKNLVLEGNVNPEFVRHYLLSAKEYAESKASGTTFLELSSKRTGELALPIAPLPEQRRIVASLNNLTDRLALARSELKHIVERIDAYRQLVLDNSFSALQQTVPLSNLVEKDRGIPYGIVRTGKDQPGGIPTVRAGDIKDFGILYEQLKQVSPHIASRYERTVLRGGEVLMTIRGSVGETCVVPASMKGNNISREVALIPVSQAVNPNFIMYFLRSRHAINYINSNVKGIAQRGINLRDLRQLPCPDIPIAEQVRISNSIAAVFRRLDRIAADRAAAAELLPKLENAIRLAAFQGRLVAQDARDEPAGTLLALIRRKRSADSKRPRIRRMKVTPKKSTPENRLLADAELWPETGLPFAKVAQRNPMPYDQLRDALFSLLAGKTPRFRQIFDTDAECIHLIWVKS